MDNKMSREYLYEEEEEGGSLIIDELLNGLNDWRAVPDIVRLTFKALSDVVKSHTTAIQELELQIATKSNRSELVQKANLTDINRLLSEIHSGTDTKSLETFHILLEEKASRKECQYLVTGKCSELKSELDKKVDTREMQAEIRALRSMLEDSSFKKRQSKDLDELYKLLEEKANIVDVATALEEKANKSAISSALHKKANKAEVDALLLAKANLSELQSMLLMLETKVDRHTIESSLRESSQKPEKAEILKIIREEVQKKSEIDSVDSVNRIKKDIDYKLNQFDKYIEALRVNIEKTQATLSEELNNKIISDPEIRTEITKITSSMRSENRKLEEKYNDRILRLDNSLQTVYEEFTEIKAKLSGLLQKFEEKDRAKLNDSGSESLRHDLRISISKEFDKIYRELSNNRSEFENFFERKLSEFKEVLDEKPSKFEITNLISESKFNRIFIEEAEQIKKSLDILGKRNMTEIYDLIDSIRTDLVQKVSTQDLIIFLKNKPDLDEVKELVSGFGRSSDDKLIIETLCSENCSGRWLWKSGDVKNGCTVPWEIQSVNTCPENFVWEKDTVSIIAVTPGLYEIFFGFFTGKKPVLQLLVNGETILTDVSGEGKAWGSHRDGNIIGATATEYVALPARARVCISYSGPRIVEGFLSLRKL